MHIFSRIRQLAFSLVMGHLPDKQLKLQGQDSLLKVPSLLKEKQISRILLATTKGTVQRGTLDPFLEALKANAIAVTVFTDIVPDPTTANAVTGTHAYVTNQCEAIVAIGGGSVIDCAKIAGALVVNPTKSVEQISGLMQIRHKTPFFIAVPTTAGTGSEITPAAVITEVIHDEHYKHPINDLHITPDVAVLDPVLARTMPQKITAYTGMDALSHIIEAYTNRFAQPKTKQAALKAMSLISQNLVQTYDDGDDLTARENMLEASYLAGYAITHNFVGYIHALSHAIGALSGLPHGYINAILMPVVLRKYGKAAARPLAELAQAAGIGQPGDDQAQATALIQFIESLNQHFKIPSSLNQLNALDIDEIATRAYNEGNPLYPVPDIWDKTDFVSVLQQLK
ncbi:iron-containing alcohol dehydrogenase [Lacticaseibacillus parakribbianus]|uniref:iron-containing alcohol dehydrogenase n=1 Tax=Lacticaseibacillus parakribbianus TaxID=2970927 RepID=UPI0021CB2D6C|nr:iron-containing alcohol dehydrogenase [Lacticaseibacillus parakribbianus]